MISSSLRRSLESSLEPKQQQGVKIRSALTDEVGARVSITLRAVETPEDAQRWAFTGSPTVWLDGVDPFAQVGALPALVCRVYATAEGLAGAPTVEQLVNAMSPLTT